MSWRPLVSDEMTYLYILMGKKYIHIAHKKPTQLKYGISIGKTQLDWLHN